MLVWNIIFGLFCIRLYIFFKFENNFFLIFVFFAWILRLKMQKNIYYFQIAHVISIVTMDVKQGLKSHRYTKKFGRYGAKICSETFSGLVRPNKIVAVVRCDLDLWCEGCENIVCVCTVSYFRENSVIFYKVFYKVFYKAPHNNFKTLKRHFKKHLSKNIFLCL